MFYWDASTYIHVHLQCSKTVELFIIRVRYNRSLSIHLSITDHVQKRQESWPHAPEKVDSVTSRIGSDKTLPGHTALFTGEGKGCEENQQTQLL